MITHKFHFMVTPLDDKYVLVDNVGPVGHAGPINVVGEWPCNGYSRDKAQARADRCVGEFIRRASSDTDKGIIVIYTHDGYKSKAPVEEAKSQLKPGAWRRDGDYEEKGEA